MSIQLRPYQADLVGQVNDAWASGAQNVLMHLPTGAGKSACLAHIVAQHEGASCVVCHRSELVSQLSQALAQYGVEHDIIASDATRRIVAAVHVQRFGRCYLKVGARCRVASIQTMVRRSGLESWAATVTLWVTDECFPAGTLVDGRPIETLKPGDLVTAFNEETGGFEKRPVARLFKNVAPDYMVRVDFGEHHYINCTAGHPFWTRRGWISAVDLTPTDEVYLYAGAMHELRNVSDRDGRADPLPIQENGSGLLQSNMRVCLSGPQPQAPRTTFRTDGVLDLCDGIFSDGVEIKSIQNNGSTILQQRMFERVPTPMLIRDDGSHESTIRLGSDDPKQPNETSGCARKGKRHSQGKRNETECAGRERKASARGGTDVDKPLLRYRFFGAMRCADSDGAGERIPIVLQTGLRKRGAEAGLGSGRGLSYDDVAQIAGSEEGHISRWARVDSATVYERANNDRSGRGGNDGYVYNIEVEGLHTYVADGVVVHNCHHLVRDNSWDRGIGMFTHPQVLGLGPTATPSRADGKGLGRHADGLIDVMVSGPSPRWLIEQGWLSDYDVMCPTSDMEVLADVAASGDWSPKVLKEASQKSHIVGDVVGSYMDAAPGRLGVTFATDVETATQMAAAYRAVGVAAEVLTGETDDRLRASILQRFERREVMQLCVVDIISEGFDVCAIEVMSMARPTQSLGLYLQQLGRGMRPVFAPGYDLTTVAGRLAAQHASGKGRKVLLIDHVGNFVRHQGGPDAPRVWTLDRRERRSKGASDAESLRVCTECFKPFKRVMTACPHCGAEIPPPAGRAGPEQVDGDLALLSPEVLAALRADLPESEAGYRERLMATGLPEVPLRANMKRHRERLDALAALRLEMAVWSGRLHADGLSDREIHKAWFLHWGGTVYDALSLSRADAIALTARVKEANDAT